jgi:GT2 family glycosyltransferase
MTPPKSHPWNRAKDVARIIKEIRMKPKLTSIIMTCKIRNKTECHMTMTAIDCISKYTNPEDYELIVVDPEPSEPIRNDHGVLPNFLHLKPSPDPDYASCMNLGASHAVGDYLVFIQNDVFVHEGWLQGLRKYLESGIWSVVYPDQAPRTRDYILDSYKRDWFDAETLKGSRDAGLIMITKEAFDKVGGWSEGFSILAERDMYERLGAAGIMWTDTNKVQITHIMGASNWKQHMDDRDGYDKRMERDAKKLNG